MARGLWLIFLVAVLALDGRAATASAGGWRVVPGSEGTLALVTDGLPASSSVPLKTAALPAPAATELSVAAESARWLCLSVKQTSPKRSLHTIVVLPRSGKAALVAEWIAESGDPACEEASREAQQVAIRDGEKIERRAHRRLVQSLAVALECGCCTALQTRTMETHEEEVLAWSETSQSLARTMFRRWYVVQPGEGLFAVARKALGDPTAIARLCRLNPGLQQASLLLEGQKILVEKQ